MKKIRILIIFLIGILPILNGDEVKKSSLYYVKMGITNPPCDSSIFPTFGLGARFQKDIYGFDLSADISSLVFINYASLKGVFLFYPYPKKKNQFYCGIGPGIGYHLSILPMGAPYGGASNEFGFLTLEGILGYEFRHWQQFKTFIQLELTQPTFGFGGHRRHSNKPGIAFTAGMGF